ncbi:hypothetical protein NST63_12275 [Heyndrickxia sp. FSL W8-0496]
MKNKIFAFREDSPKYIQIYEQFRLALRQINGKIQILNLHKKVERRIGK